MSIENTTKRDPALHVMGAMVEGSNGYIEGMEAAGQRQLVTSEVLPRLQNASDFDRFEALGFTFGEPVEGDDLFRHATLPEGWQRRASDHPMWSYVVDERGLRRVAIFYKAAFYDRDAFMRTVDVGGQVVSEWLYSDAPIPWDLLTEEERTAAVAALRTMADNEPEFYKDTPAKARDELERIGG